MMSLVLLLVVFWLSPITSGIQSQTVRGPLCFACDYQSKLDDCAHFRQCGRGEVCVLQEKLSLTTGQVMYSTNCMQASKCTTIYQRMNSIMSIVGKRNVNQSLHIGTDCKIKCCDSDFCNGSC